MLTEMWTRWSFEGSHCWWLCFMPVGVKMKKSQTVKEIYTFKMSIPTSLASFGIFSPAPMSLIHSSVYGICMIISFPVEKMKTWCSYRNKEQSEACECWLGQAAAQLLHSVLEIRVTLEPSCQRQVRPGSSWIRSVGLGHHAGARSLGAIQKALFAPDGQLKAGTSSMG